MGTRKQSRDKQSKSKNSKSKNSKSKHSKSKSKSTQPIDLSLNLKVRIPASGQGRVKRIQNRKRPNLRKVRQGMGGLTAANLQQPSFFGNTALLSNSAMAAMNNRTYALESQIRDNQSEIKAFIQAGKANDARVQLLEADNTSLVNDLQQTRTRGQGVSSRLRAERDQAYVKFGDISKDLELLEQRNQGLTEELSRSRASASGSRLSPTLESLFSGGGSTIRPEASQTSAGGNPTPQQSYGRHQIIEAANAKDAAQAVLEFHLERGNRFLRGAKWEQQKAKFEENVRQTGQEFSRVKAELDQRTKSFNPTVSYSAEQPEPEPQVAGSDELEGQSLFVGGVGAGSE